MPDRPHARTAVRVGGPASDKGRAGRPARAAGPCPPACSITSPRSIKSLTIPVTVVRGSPESRTRSDRVTDP